MKDEGGIEVKKAAGYTALEIRARKQNLPVATFDSAPSQKEKLSEFRLVFRLNIWGVGGQNG